MRRRPSGAYRVIDEEELLGGGASPDEAEHGSEFMPHAGHGRRKHRHRRLGAATGWGSTAAAIAALAGVAALLLTTSAHAPASPPPSRDARAGRHPQQSTAAAALVTVGSRPPRPRAALEHPDGRMSVLRSPAARRRSTAQRGSPRHARARRRPGRPLVAARAQRRVLAAAARETSQPPERRAAPTPATVPAAGAAVEFGFER
jgi:hypothetical protein